MLVGNNGINSLKWSEDLKPGQERELSRLNYLYQRLSILKQVTKKRLSKFCLFCDLVRRTSFAGRPCDLVPRETPQTIRDLFPGETSFPKGTMRTRLLQLPTMSGVVLINVISCSFVFRYLSFLSCTGLLFIFSMVAMIFFYKYFAHDAQCRTNLYFVSFSLCQCVAATVISVLPRVQEAQSGTGK